MNGRDFWWHPGSRCFDEFSIGERFITPGRTVVESDVQAFAGLSGDYSPLQTDAVAAAAGDAKGRVCHSLLPVSILTGLIVPRLGVFEATGFALLALDDLEFLKPVRIGDTIHAELEVTGMRESRSKPDFGVVIFRIEGKDQDDDRFCVCEWHEWVARTTWKARNKEKFANLN